MAGPGKNILCTLWSITDTVMQEGTKYRITLNNHTQNTPALGKPEYENTSAGKSNEAVWTSVVTSKGAAPRELFVLLKYALRQSMEFHTVEAARTPRPAQWSSLRSRLWMTLVLHTS